MIIVFTNYAIKIFRRNGTYVFFLTQNGIRRDGIRRNGYKPKLHWYPPFAPNNYNYVVGHGGVMNGTNGITRGDSPSVLAQLQCMKSGSQEANTVVNYQNEN